MRSLNLDHLRTLLSAVDLGTFWRNAWAFACCCGEAVV
jgi:hypothetical protein